MAVVRLVLAAGWVRTSQKSPVALANKGGHCGYSHNARWGHCQEARRRCGRWRNVRCGHSQAPAVAASDRERQTAEARTALDRDHMVDWDPNRCARRAVNCWVGIGHWFARR